MRTREKQTKILPGGEEVGVLLISNVPVKYFIEIDDYASANGLKSRKDALLELIEKGLGRR